MRRGRKSSHPSGFGFTTKDGYHGAWYEGRNRYVHTIVWEDVYGPIPEGFSIHHKNGNKQDNRLSNLKLVDALTHSRIHSGCKLRKGIWWKPCSTCGKFKKVCPENWYFTKQGRIAGGGCKRYNARSTRNKQIRRAKRRGMVEIPIGI